jgi:hypothetical protein
MPASSPAIRGQHETERNTPEHMRRLDEAWRDAASKAVENQQQSAAVRFPSLKPDERNKAWKAVLKGVGNGDPATLSKELMKMFGEKVLADSQRNIKEVWRLSYETWQYPA